MVMDNNKQPPNLSNIVIEDPQSWTVLLVDDDMDNLIVASTVLEFNGATVYRATDGVEGLKVLETVTPSLILLDLSMPNLDGWGAFKKIRADERTQSIPVIAVTAHAMTDDEDRVMQAGFDGYIAKPFRIGTFLEVIQDRLRNMPNRSDTPAPGASETSEKHDLSDAPVTPAIADTMKTLEKSDTPTPSDKPATPDTSVSLDKPAPPKLPVRPDTSDAATSGDVKGTS